MSDVEALATERDVEAICKEQNSVSPYDGSNIQFTSGTTGKPKATILSHRSLVNNSRQVHIIRYCKNIITIIYNKRIT